MMRNNSRKTSFGDSPKDTRRNLCKYLRCILLISIMLQSFVYVGLNLMVKDESYSAAIITSTRAATRKRYRQKRLPGAKTFYGIDKKNGIDWSDQIFRRTGWDIDPIVLESHKLLFFSVPKIACTEFKMLLRRMMGFPDWKKVGSKSEKLHDPNRNGLRYLGSFPRRKQEEFMISEDWTRAIFVRDPRERLLSAYIDKGLSRYKESKNVTGGYVKSKCCNFKRPLPNPKLQNNKRVELELYRRCLPLSPLEKDTTEDTFPFRYFVDKFMAHCRDPHWEPQSNRLKAANWKKINFVGHFDNLKEDAHQLLRKIGAFEEFGLGWGPENKTIFEKNLVLHATSSKDKLHRYFHGNSTELETIVLKYYRNDYLNEVINLTKPESWGYLMGKHH
mmetsp:Transcript_790/g.1756  ORF Transcript_790/g.1756 Transcript_790/m.1756 type:complete len:389 (-) Transcript_790:64-1230(-)